MNLYIRADADSKIGTGHIMRCIALAQAWQDRGGEVMFISHCESDALRERIIQEGFQFIAVENPHPHPSDLEETLNLLSKIRNPQSAIRNWLVLDGYHFTPDYQKAIPNAGIRLLVIDDMNHLPYYHTDILLNQNIHAPDLKYRCDEDTSLLLGTRYVLLRREFLKYRDFKRRIPDKAKNILVTLGGADLDNVTMKVIEAIKLLNNPNLEVRVVVGPSNPHGAELKDAMLSAPCPMHCIKNAGNMPELMAWADVAVSGGGSSCWELAFMGLPMVVLILAHNQEAAAKMVAKKGVSICLGEGAITNPQIIAQVLAELLKDYDTRCAMAKNGALLVDGKGASEVVKYLVNPQDGGKSMNALRDVRPEDKEMILQWRNLSEFAKYMYTDHFITPEEHEKWFQRILQDPACHYWNIVCDGQDVGLTNIYNLDKQNRRCYWAFYVASPNVRGKGVGSFVEYSILHYVFDELQLNKLCCEVLAFNEAVTGMHKSFGFKQEGLFREHIFKGGQSNDVVCLAMLRNEWKSLKPDIEKRLRQKGLL